MASLYIDTTYSLIFGLLDEDCQWLDYQVILPLKDSPFFHRKIYETLEKHHLKLRDIKTLFVASGPGSYTGIRLTQSLSQMLTLQGTKIFSFYHFEIPAILGVKKGLWLGHAFKGEWFFYSWDGENHHQKLVLHRELSSELLISAATLPLYSHSAIEPKLVDEGHFVEMKKKNNALFGTIDLLYENGQRIFPYLKDQLWERKPFYYRKVESEFKVQCE